MMESLELLEVGHLKLKPVFPSVVLGHLFLRKYGLSREQRSQVIRSTGGSSRFEDIEKVIRASDFENSAPEPGHRALPHRAHRREVMAADEESSIDEPSDLSEEIQEAVEETDDEELEEAYEIQKKAKANAKKAFRNYKDSRRKVREIKKDRQPYMPVVAIPPGSSATPDSLPVQPTFRYDKKDAKKGGKGGRRGNKEEAHFVRGEVISEFAYMVQTEEATELEILAVDIPMGMAPGHWLHGFRHWRGDSCEMHRVLRQERSTGASGAPTAASAAEGLQWCEVFNQKRDSLDCDDWLAVGPDHYLCGPWQCSFSSAKHGMQEVSLAQASNGHLLLPLVPDLEADSESFNVTSEPGPAPVEENPSRYNLEGY